MSFFLPLAAPKANPIAFWSQFELWKRVQARTKPQSVSWSFISLVISKFEQCLSFLSVLAIGVGPLLHIIFKWQFWLYQSSC